MLSYFEVEFQLVNNCLNRSDVIVTCGAHKDLGSGAAYFEPLLLVAAKLIWPEFTTSWMSIVITVNFRVALEAHRYSIIYFISAAISLRYDVVSFDFYTAKTVAHAASAVTLDQ